MSVEIVVIVPVLGRPDRVAPLIESFERAATVHSQLLFVTSPGDEAEREAIRRANATSIEALWEPGPGDYARKINFATAWSGRVWKESPHVFAGADDLCFCEGWDRAALSVAEETGAGMVGTDDLWNPQVRRGLHSTHSLFSRRWVGEGASWDGPGTVYSEAYDHQWIDAEAVAVAKARGEWAFAWESRVEHLHPFAGKSARDETYEKALRASAADRALFEDRRRRFG